MIVEVAMPSLGLTMERGVIVTWLKAEGDKVEAGEPLFLIETDKAPSEAPSPATGILARIVRGEGESVAVGTLIAYLAETAQDLDQVRAAPRPATPGVDLAAAAPQAGRLTTKDVFAPSPPPPIIPLSRTRKIIAERMTLSATTIPQVTYTLRCDITEALALRRTLKSGSGGERAAVSLDALIVRAVAVALTVFPEVNSQWTEGQGIRLLTEVNIAVAVDLEERGLVIPVIHAADSLDIKATAAELDRLTSGARAGKLGPDDYAGGTFTITSLASLGVETFNPIIVPPQAAILGVGAIVPTPVFQRDEVVKRRLLALSLTTDHRILDGGPSARFLNRVRDLLEQPAKLAT